jgi:general secretion pathway protein M
MARFPSSSSAAADGLKARLSQARDQALAQWQTLGERERIAAGGIGVLLGLALAWGVLLAPALRTLKTAPGELEKLELQLQQMQAQAQEARTLRAAPTVPPAQAQAALKASVDHLGAAARLTLAGDRATVTLNGISSAALQAFLGEVRSAARARPIEAQLTRGPNGYSGSITLSLGEV